MNIQERIKNISEYFIGMQMSTEDNVVYVRTRFPDKWVISELLEDNFNVRGIQDKKNNTQFFFTNIENGFDVVFDAIDFTIQMNKSALERLELFKEKVEELKELFDSEEIEKLRRLEFTFKKAEKKQRKKKLTANNELATSITADVSNPIEAYNNITEDPIPALIENKDYIETQD